ncbi:MAG: DNA-binding protein, partial [Pseudomonadota bacterium]
MKTHAKVPSSIWTGALGKKLREAGPEAQRVAFYLLTSPTSNILGLYYLSIASICHEVGINEEQVKA